MIRILLLGVAALAAGACRTPMDPRVPEPPGDPSDDWNAVLGRVVTEGGWVDYPQLRQHRDALDRYVSWLARDKARPKGARARHTFWLNAYTALTLWTVLEEGIPASVTEVGGWGPGDAPGFFFSRSYKVGRDRVSLWDITHERVRLRNLDPRSHGGLTCPARSCPPVRPGLYGGASLPYELAEQMRAWVNDPVRGVLVDEDGTVAMNPLLHTWRRDIELWGGETDLCTWLRGWAESDLREALRAAGEGGCTYRVYDFDWGLNSAP